MQWRLHAVVALSVAALLTGCGSGIDTATVRGKVTLGGQPVPNVIVNFQPENGRPAVGQTDASGNYELSTISSGDGAVPGMHKVSFSIKTEPPPSTAVAKQMSGPVVAAPFNVKYRSGETSGLTREVKAGESNVFDFELEK
ncbi:MAG TPA: hypothetical protein VFV87_03475 [Pirellulaceae bacterium]|nr:hypothetical protein [Pirellulaceae bacterium]